ncbi:MAG: diguanylate cyclase, partial [Pyrinomonadaceae bacterium]|nr:diguanylate cyclase [Pyrinomonadaceae bacterium]
HGIGKLAVPDYILNKPTRLTSPEMDKVKVYTRVGAEIVEKIGFPYPVAEAIQHLHEHWNGNGYPEGLRGEEIPITARILAIADVYDTIRESRPFRPAKSREEARRLLLSSAGTHFDPKIIDVFLRHLGEFEAEIEVYFTSNQPRPVENPEVHTSQLTVNAAPIYLEQIRQANREVFALYELAKLSSASLGLEDLLKFLVEKVGELVPCETIIIYLLDEERKTASVAIVSGKNEASLQKMKVKVGEGVTGFVLQNESFVSSVSPALDFTAEFVETAQNYSTMAAMPLMTGGHLIGALSIYSETLTGYDEDHLRLLETASNIIADSIWRTMQHAESENRALTDLMTGLPNARGLQMHFNKEVARSSRSNRPFQMIMFDLDDFKKVNDTFGHKVGDLVLNEISQLMRMQLRELDFLARYAGDEFVAILPEISDESLRELCDRIKKTVADYSLQVSENGAAQVGISIGVATYPIHGETLDKVLVAADRNMYADKAKHKSSTNLKLDEENILTIETQAI